MTVDQDRLMAFVGQMVTDLGAAVVAGGVVIGHRLGLYRALAAGPATPEELARRTETSTRYITEWLAAQAASGYVQYDADAGTFALDEEQAFALTDPDGPALPPRGVRPRPRRPAGGTTDHRGLPHRCRAWAGTSTTRTSSTAARCSSGPATSRTWCPPGSRRWTASRRSCAPGPASPTWAAATVRPPSYGAGLPGIDDHRLGLPRRLGPDRPQARRRGRRGRPDVLRGGLRRDVLRSRPRPRDLLRLPARHGRSARRRAPRPRVAGRGRDVDGRGAPRRGHARRRT